LKGEKPAVKERAGRKPEKLLTAEKARKKLIEMMPVEKERNIKPKSCSGRGLL